MAATSCGTLVNTPRRSRLTVMSRKKRSTMFSHDAEVGREVHVKARVLGQPVLHHRVLVRGVVVGDQVQRFVLGCLAVDLLEELQPLHMGVALLALAR